MCNGRRAHRGAVLGAVWGRGFRQFGGKCTYLHSCQELDEKHEELVGQETGKQLVFFFLTLWVYVINKTTRVN